MAIMSLAEAKAELEEQEQLETPEVDKPAKPERETLKLAPKKEPAQEESEESEESTEESPISDAWMKGDEEEESEVEGSDKEDPLTKNYTHKDIYRVKNKLKGRLKLEKDEKERLAEENAELKKRLESTIAKPATLTQEPKPDQYKSDAEYQKALTIYLLDDRENKAKQEQQLAQQRQAYEAQQASVGKSVEAHYDRRAALAKKSNISDEAMGGAEQAFRQAIDDVRPGAGDLIVDQLIDILGKGSEMVIHKLGVSRGAREKAAQLLKDDPQGRYLIAYAAELKANLVAPMKRESRAPEPPAQIQGDKSNKSSNSRLMKEYEAAEKSGDSQRIWEARKALRAAGTDVDRL
jgi:hypothetical protein